MNHKRGNAILDVDICSRLSSVIWHCSILSLICDEMAGVRHDKIADEIGELHEAGLGLADMKGVLEMFVEHIDHSVTKCPREKRA